MEIAAVDVTICIIIAISGIISLIRGFIKEAMSLVIWLAAFFVAMSFKEVFAELLVGLIELASMRQLAAWGILFVATLLLGAMVNFLLGKLVTSKVAIPLDGPVSGGCPRATTGNIAIFVGGERKLFERILPVLTAMGREILHTGELGSASTLKVITNYLASTHLVALGEAWAVAKKSNLDMNKTFKGIQVSSGNSFVHETESQVILNGSYNINFTMDLVEKDMTLFNNLSKKLNIPLEISPLVLSIFKDAHKKYGSRAWSSMVVKRLEDICKINFREKGYPDKLVDKEKEEKGYEI